jgi:hypothetical protein
MYKLIFKYIEIELVMLITQVIKNDQGVID